jgi:hypothetical protein
VKGEITMAKIKKRSVVKEFLVRKMKYYNLEFISSKQFDHYDNYVFTLDTEERKGLVEIDYMEKEYFGYNLTIHRGAGKKTLVYDTRFNMSFEDLVDELGIYIRQGE